MFPSRGADFHSAASHACSFCNVFSLDAPLLVDGCGAVEIRSIEIAVTYIFGPFIDPLIILTVRSCNLTFSFP